MRVALISDLHSNLAALSAVLGDIRDVEAVICCGDIVGYYDQPNEVCDLLREKRVLCIRGNHDAYVLGALVPKLELREAYRTDWTRDVLQQDHLLWLAGLPTELHLSGQSESLLVRHASPWDEETYLYGNATGMLSRLSMSTGETLAVGHTHHPLLLDVSSGRLVNPGSVGQPRDRDPRASYAIHDLAAGATEIRRVAYDVSAVQDRLTRKGWNPSTVEILSRT